MRHLPFVSLLAVLAIAPAIFADSNTNTPTANAPFPVTITVDAGKSVGELKPIWRFFGADEPNYAYMKDGKKLIGELGQLGGSQVYFRAHHLLTSGDGAYSLKFGSSSAYKEDTNGTPVYDWSINDKIFDTYLARGVKPYAQIGFMPEALSTHPQNYPHNPPVDKKANVGGGQSYPPKDYAKWGELSYQWTKHCVERYGADEVNKWYWEVWNEANISYWHGTVQDFCKLYDYAIDGVRRALPTARVGGPETAGDGGQWTRNFLEHCLRGTNYATGKIGTPLDFFSYHAKGSPAFTNSQVRMGIANELRAIDSGFALIKSYPELKNIPIVIGECDPDSCAACTGNQFGYRNTTMYSSYTAASFTRALDLADERGVNLQGALTWAFEFEDQPPFAGFRTLATDGLDLPVLNVFRMFAKMSGARVAVKSSAGFDAQTILKSGVRGSPDVSALASLDKNKLAILVWYYYDDDLPGADAAVDLKIGGLPLKNTSATLTQYIIDADHSNSYEAWLKMGSPLPLSDKQYAELEKVGQLTELEPQKNLHMKNGKLDLNFALPRQAVSLLVLTWN
jgi:xylan 1,4-beta-xylosidase